MSETPLTDAEVARILETPMNHASRFAAMAEFANRLERKIATMKQAGDAIVDHNIGCGCGQDGPCRACSMASEAWAKAKGADL